MARLLFTTGSQIQFFHQRLFPLGFSLFQFSFFPRRTFLPLRISWLGHFPLARFPPYPCPRRFLTICRRPLGPPPWLGGPFRVPGQVFLLGGFSYGQSPSLVKSLYRRSPSQAFPFLFFSWSRTNLTPSRDNPRSAVLLGRLSPFFFHSSTAFSLRESPSYRPLSVFKTFSFRVLRSNHFEEFLNGLLFFSLAPFFPTHKDALSGPRGPPPLRKGR